MKKIFDIEKVGFGDEMGEPVTTNRLTNHDILPQAKRQSWESAKTEASHKKVADGANLKSWHSKTMETAPVPENKVPAFKPAASPNQRAASVENSFVPRPAIKEPSEKAVPKAVATGKKEPSPFKAVEFISPISGSRQKKPEKLHLAHGQYLVGRRELIARETKAAPAADEAFVEEVVNLAKTPVEVSSYYELPPLQLLPEESSLRKTLASPDAMLVNHPLMLALGTDSKGSGVIGNLGRLGHHLNDGEKPGLLDAQVLGMLFKSGPADLRLVMMDSMENPLTGYEGLPHLALPILRGKPRLKAGLEWLIDECQRRLRLLQSENAAHIEAFNELRPTFDQEYDRLPYLVVVSNDWEQAKGLPQVAGLLLDGPKAGIHFLASSHQQTAGFGSLSRTGYWQFEGEAITLENAVATSDDVEKVMEHIKKQLELVYLLDALAIESLPLTEEDEIDPGLEGIQIPKIPPRQPEATVAESKPVAEVREVSQESLFESMELFLDKNHVSYSLLQTKLGFSYAQAVRVVGELYKRGWVGQSPKTPYWELNLSQSEYLEITA
ncbi:MAG: FtsK/SpoIIIE domain-containing protein [Turicibacter sp.]|nr:FtsK/SpoIIIE domain-containing protein [Turicibacter sp.]